MKMNNNVLAAGMVVAVLALFPSVNAGAGVREDKDATDITHSYTVGTEISHITYEEPVIMEESGMFYGIAGEYAARFPQRIVLMAEGRLAYGQVDYTSRGTGSLGNIDDFLGEVRGLVGYDLYAFDATRATPYIGLGYRYLLDKLGGRISSTGALGYDRESNYYYVPVGVKLLTQAGDKFSWGITAEFDYLIEGRQKSHLGDVAAGLDTLENTQENGWGARGSVPLMMKVSEFDLLVEPYIRYWDIDRSNTKAVTYSGTPVGLVGYEPENTSTEYGVKLGARF